VSLQVLALALLVVEKPIVEKRSALSVVNAAPSGDDVEHLVNIVTVILALALALVENGNHGNGECPIWDI
jgi:hypothetical protein